MWEDRVHEISSDNLKKLKQTDALTTTEVGTKVSSEFSIGQSELRSETIRSSIFIMYLQPGRHFFVNILFVNILLIIFKYLSIIDYSK